MGRGCFQGNGLESMRCFLRCPQGVELKLRLSLRAWGLRFGIITISNGFWMSFCVSLRALLC